MLITKVEIFKAALPLKRPFRIAIGLTTVAHPVFVRVHTDEGHYGMGEADLMTAVVGETQATAIAVGQDIAKILIGTDPLDIEGRNRQMRAFTPGAPTTRSAFDMALHDILGKATGLPLYALFGGSRRRIHTDNTVGLDSIEEMAARAREIQGRGFPAIKVKLGTDAETDLARIEAIRAAVGPDLPIRIDANQGWDVPTAVHVLARIASYNIEYCEQPVRHWDVEGLAAVHAASPIPIMADEAVFDEHDALKLVRAQACSYLNIKLAKSSGLHTALKINAVAEAAGLKCMIGCMTETRLGLTAAAHLASARPNIAFADLDGADMLRDDPVIGGMIYGAGGEISVPEEPGLGADFDPDYLKGLETFAVTEGVSG